MNKKRILITGKGSYVGSSFMKWVEQWPEQYEVKEISVRTRDWENIRFSEYDVILHVAAIVHRKKRAQPTENYYKVNYELPLELAKKAKKEGVKQFIFLSTMAVYGLDGQIGKLVTIDQNTKCNPLTDYAKSKLLAENELVNISHENFKVVILRPPMIYGEGCKGNYQRLKKLVCLPVFPDIENQRSMLSINNLVRFIIYTVVNQKAGLFYPQDNCYYSIKDMVRDLAKSENKVMKFTKVFNPFIILAASCKVKSLNKMFGNLTYAKTENGDFIV